MLDEKIEQALNAQITLEGQSSHAYLAMAVWAETSGFDGTAAFLYPTRKKSGSTCSS